MSLPRLHDLHPAARLDGSVPEAAWALPDARADGGRRDVLLSRERVRIDRTLRGVAMRVAVPVTGYSGVCLSLKQAGSQEPIFAVDLMHRDADLSVTLAETHDEGEAWSAWRSWSRFLGRPALVARNDGPEPSRMACVAGPAVATKRRVRRRRRPTLVSRRYARPDAVATVHRERELIART